MSNRNNTSKQIELLRNLNLDGKLTSWHYFDKCKRVYLKLVDNKLSDLSGGLIKLGQVSSTAKLIGLSRQRFTHYLNKWVGDGWATKTKNGYLLKSWKVVAELYDVHGCTKRNISGETKKELLVNFAYTAIKSNHKQQTHEHFRKVQEKRGKLSSRLLKTQSREYASSENVSTSCRQMINQLGFFAAITGSKLLKKLKVSNMI